MAEPKTGHTYRGNVNGAFIKVIRVTANNTVEFADEHGRRFTTNVDTFRHCDIDEFN